MRTVPVIIGPTAGGKSSLALGLAEHLASRTQPAELVTADAYQVYRRMDIGTAKPSPAEQAKAPHHLIDIREPTETFTVHEWLREANAAIEAIHGRSALPIVVGGTHLFIKALLDGLFEGPEPDAELRERLEAQPGPALRARLETIDPAAAQRIHPNDRRRTIRAIEVYQQTGTPISELQTQWDSSPRGGLLLVVLDWPVEAINRRINARVREMVASGLVEEARELWKSGQLGPTAREALGYKQLISHFEGPGSLEDAIEQIKIETRRFAKKQRTWIKRLTPGRASIRLCPDDAARWVELVAAALEQADQAAS